MSRPSPFRAVVAAAALTGVDGLRAQGVYVDREAFDVALDAIWRLGDDRLASVTPVERERNSPDDGLMDANAVAARLDLSPHTVRKAARLGQLEGHQDERRRWRFTPEAVADWRAS